MKTVVITGASRGIGAATAIECARRGMGVVLTYRHQADAARSVVQQIEAQSGRAIALSLDVGNTSSFAAFRATLEATVADVWGRSELDALVNNAGHGLYCPIDQVSEAQFESLFSVHLKGPFFLTQTLLPLLADGGQIVNVCSATTRVATAGVAPYASCKGGLEVLTRYMAKELGVRGIRANAVSPGSIRTELGGGLTLDFEAALAAQTALGHVGEPKDVARVIASLLGDDLGWVNAQSIEVSGGYVI